MSVTMSSPLSVLGVVRNKQQSLCLSILSIACTMITEALSRNRTTFIILWLGSKLCIIPAPQPQPYERLNGRLNANIRRVGLADGLH